jgi:hypothetical protein
MLLPVAALSVGTTHVPEGVAVDVAVVATDDVRAVVVAGAALVVAGGGGELVVVGEAVELDAGCVRRQMLRMSGSCT